MSNTIDLFGLVGEDVILYNRILGTFYKNMTKINISSSTKCNITIDKLVLENSHNCFVNIKNNCFVNSSIGLSVLFNSILENLKFINSNTRQKLEKNLGVVLNKDTDQKNKGFFKRCAISSETTNNISVNSLFIKNCTSDYPLEFTFFNTGDSNTNCGIVTLLNALGIEDNDKKIHEPLNKVFGLNMIDYIYILIIAVSFTLLLLLPLGRKVTSLDKYKYTAKIN